MTPACCHNCIYSCWDLCQVTQSFFSGFPHRPMCANQPDAPARMRPTPIGPVCRNYRARPPAPEGDVRHISLGSGLYAYVDAADYEWLSRYCWYVQAGGYAARREKGKIIMMHREIMQPPEGMVVDHIDGNKANNCRFNLRVCTPTDNQHNQAKRRGASSRFKGVGYVKSRGKYRARFKYNGQPVWLGFFDDETEAARAYDYKAVECCGPLARLNLPEEWSPERIQQVYKPQLGHLEKEGEKAERGVKTVKGKEVRNEEGKGPRAGKGRGKTRPRRAGGNRSSAKKPTHHAEPRGRGTRVARRRKKSARG
jgi:hypothetical protein